ncbi:MAG: Serine phosphatase RsbU, regulator of sigma subunit, partial [uncultured Solirubrobacteraceae bacterium]
VWGACRPVVRHRLYRPRERRQAPRAVASRHAERLRDPTRQHRRQGRRPPSPSRVRGPARARQGPDVAELPQRALEHLVRGRPRILRAGAASRSASARSCGPHGPLSGLSRRPLPLRHRGGSPLGLCDRERRSLM